MYFLIPISAALLALVLILIIRALSFKPEADGRTESEPITVDSDFALYTLREMIKKKTVSSADKSMENTGEFSDFAALLPSLFPSLFKAATVETPSDRSILIRYRGKSASSPTVFMAHYDVVSVDDSGWLKPPFDAIYEDGYLWGRGTIDTKVTLNGILVAAESLAKEGFVPENDMYFAFAGDEEIGGYGAPSIVSLFKERGITPSLVLDEGGAVVEGVFPGVNKPTALIGIAEKGMLNISYTVKGGGGHSSAPARETPIGILSKACIKVESKPAKFRITEPAKLMFDKLARHSSFGYRLIFANLWLFAPILNLITKKSRGELSALVRTTDAFTKMKGSDGMNVIPPTASLVSNHRIIHGETVDSVKERIVRAVNDERVEISVINGMNPSVVSAVDSEGYSRLSSAVGECWGDAVVSPYLMLACSDSRHYGEISDKVYRFSALALSREERALIHGNNERISIESITKNAEFYIRLMKKS